MTAEANAGGGPRLTHRSVPEVRALRPRIDDDIGVRLDRLARKGRLPLRCGRVNRKAVFDEFGLQSSTAIHLGVADDHFRRHDDLLAEAGVPTRKHSNLAAQVTAFLEAKRGSDELIYRKKGRGLSREWIARELGFPKQVFVTDRDVAKAAEDFYAVVADDQPARGKYANLHLEMAKFLEEGWRSGTLELEADGVGRSWLAAQFGVHTPVYGRYPETRRVVDEFNARIRGLIAVSPTYPTLLNDLRALIRDLTAEGRLPIFKDRLNETELARLLRVRPDAFRLVPECLEILKQTNTAVRQDDPLRPWHEGHQRNYAFHVLVEPYGPERAADLARRFCDVAGPSAGAAKLQLRLLLKLMGVVAKCLPSRTAGDLAASGAAGGIDLEAALRRWRSDHLSESREPHVLSGEITVVGALLRRMRLFGDATDVLVRVPNAGASRPKRSLAEAPVHRVEEIAKVVSGYAASHSLEYDRQEVEAFIGNLALTSDLADVGVDQLPEAIRRLNRERLDRILACANIAFEQGMEKHARGLELLQLGTRQADVMDRMLAENADGRRPWTEVVRFFADRGDEGLAAYLHHVERDHGGLLPRATKNSNVAESVRYSRITTGLGGIAALDDMLHPSERTVAAACLIYTAEAGANSAVARGLRIDCLGVSTVPGHVVVEGWKERTGGPIVSDLPSGHRDGSPSAIGVIRELLEAHPRLARLAAPADRRSLFLATTAGHVRPIAEHRLLHLLRTITRLDPTLGEFDLRVDMIRSSVLLDAALSADGNIAVAGAIANHASEDMTSHYVLKMPLRLLYERKMREFTSAFEAVLLGGIDGAAKRLGMAVERVEASLAKAMRTGLGRMCLRPKDGLQPGTVPGEPCDRLQACSGCPAAVIVADLDLVTELVIWHGSLVEAAETWPPERMERFEANWLDDLAFCDAALEALGRGSHVRLLRQARAAAERRLADPSYERPRPW